MWAGGIAKTFLRWLAVPPGSHWLDVGCGTGALSEAIVHQAAPVAVTGVDSAEGFLDYARKHLQDGRVLFKSGNAMALPFDDDTFIAVVSGLALNFFTKPERALAEMVRVAVCGGIVAVYVWDYAGEKQMLRVFWDAAVELDAAIAVKEEGRRFPLCQPGPLMDLFDGSEQEYVELTPIDVTTRFCDFEDYWQPFLGGQGPAVQSFIEKRRTALREQIRSKLSLAADGSIALRVERGQFMEPSSNVRCSPHFNP